MNNNTMELTLEGIAFNGLKSDFNTMLRKTLNKMCQKESEQAEISVKVKISFDGANMFFMSDRGIYPIRYSGGEYYVENFKEDTFFRNIPIRFLRNQEDKKFDFYMKIESSADAARFENIQS